MKIIILAAAALVATTLSAAAAHVVEGGHDDGVLGTPGWAEKEAIGEVGGVVGDSNERGRDAVRAGGGELAARAARPLIDGEVAGTRMPDALCVFC